MLLLARHGRTAANAGGLVQGRVDLALDDTGRAQAAALATVVGKARRVVTSPLRRARETAEAFGLPVTVDERWIELDYGEWDQRPLTSVSEETWRVWRADADFAPPGGESLADLGRRVRAACEDLMEEAVGDDIVVVSHVSPIKAAVAWALEASDLVSWRLHLDVASLSRIAIRPSGPAVLLFNSTAHLG
jgi:broad specificity phosphatase PhoE